MSLDPFRLRAEFPALRRVVDGRNAAFLDGPGGTQAPQSVLDAMTAYLSAGSCNLGGPFLTSRETGEVADQARAAVADLFNAAAPDEIVFGQNMTSLTFAMSRALARTWQPGDAIAVSRLDHDANVTPWVMAAADRGVEVRFVDFDPDAGCVVDPGSLDDVLASGVRLLAMTHASNALGTVVDVRRVAAKAHAAGALVYVDAVHYAPHGLIDVQALDCDFLVASAYKFFGPHTGILYGKRRHLEALEAYKVRPAPADPPEKWETGTQSFESMAGVTAAVDYLASLGGDREDAAGSRREALVRAMQRIGEYEKTLGRRFLDGVAEIPGVTVYGITDDRPRTPTFGVSIDALAPREVARRLGELGIFVWSGHYYAVEVMDRIGLLDDGGLVRIGFVHYNTSIEVDRVVAALRALAVGADPADLPEFRPRIDEDAELAPYEAYALTDLPDPRTVSRTRIADALAEIIAVEGPVTTDRAYQVLIKAAGGKKVTASVRADLDWALDLLVERGKVDLEEFPVPGGETQRVVRRTGMARVRLRELGERDLYKVPLSEVAEVVAAVHWSHPNAGEEDLKRATLERYGLKRLTPTAADYLGAALRLAGV